MRRWLLLLFCLILPLHGWAGLQLERTPCPMVTPVVGQPPDSAAEAPVSSDAPADCCQDLTQCLQPGQACQGSLGAGSPLLGLPPDGVATANAGAGPRPAMFAGPERATTDPDCPWRPPAAT